MARSKYIYYVEVDGKPHAAFTVKHELVKFIANDLPTIDWDQTHVFRLSDGDRTGFPPERIDWMHMLCEPQP